MSHSIHLRIAQIIPCTEAEGPGRRFAVWFQGCPLRCSGCCNPEMLPFEGGELLPIDEVITRLENAVKTHGVEGITLIGGEPFAHAAGAAALARAARERSLGVMVFSGYTLEELRGHANEHVMALLSSTDLLVDGPYQRDLPDTTRRWIGSTNQRIHFLTGRYSPNDPCWSRRNTLEIRLQEGELTINGFPSREATSLWKPLRWV